ncbi:hypothetical protein CPB86DRAFT_261685 [Serendipita vermifera]|nr:hypothetical protein CPB86DRAFT_261685 [Serendipita vermifera]
MDWVQYAISRILGPSLKEVTEKEYFLPDNKIVPATKSAIPQRFEMKPENSSVTNDVYIDRADDELVFDLEPSRYPLKVQLDKELPNRMIEQLRRILGDKPIDPEFYKYWQKRHILVSPPVRSKSDTTLLLFDFWTLATRYIDHIRPNNEYRLELHSLTRDRRALTDVCIKLGSKTVIVADAIDPALDETYAAGLVNLASGKQPPSFEGDTPKIIHGHEGVLAKVNPFVILSMNTKRMVNQLSYAIMEECDEKPRWAMIYGGNSYVIYLVLPVLVGNTRRCALVSSGILHIDDTGSPFIAIMLYMLLSSDMSHESISKTLDIKPPVGGLITASNQNGELPKNPSQHDIVDCSGGTFQCSSHTFDHYNRPLRTTTFYAFR